MQPDHGVVLDQHVVRARLRDLPGREAHHDQTALEGDALRRALEGVAPNRVVDDVGAMTAGEVLHRLGDVLLVVLDHQVGAEPPADCGLLRRADRGDDDRTGGLAELDGGAADAARGAVHQQELAGLELRPAVQAEPARLVVDEERGRLLEGHRVRNLEHVLRARMRELGVAAAAKTVRLDPHQDTVAGLETAVAENADHDARHLGAGHERQVWFLLVGPRDQEGIEEVDAGGFHRDAQHARRCAGVG